MELRRLCHGEFSRRDDGKLVPQRLSLLGLVDRHGSSTGLMILGPDLQAKPKHEAAVVVGVKHSEQPGILDPAGARDGIETPLAMRPMNTSYRRGGRWFVETQTGAKPILPLEGLGFGKRTLTSAVASPGEWRCEYPPTEV